MELAVRLQHPSYPVQAYSSTHPSASSRQTEGDYGGLLSVNYRHQGPAAASLMLIHLIVRRARPRVLAECLIQVEPGPDECPVKGHVATSGLSGHVQLP